MRAVTLPAAVFTVAVALYCPLAAAPPPPAPSTGAPTIDELIALQRPASPAISPDGRWIACTARTVNWTDDRYDTQIWLVDVKTGVRRQLTDAPKSSTAPAWSPDGRWLAFGSDRGERRQIYLIDPTGGEAQMLTTGEEAAGAFKWSHHGQSIAYTMTDPAPDALKAREKTYGQFDVIGQEHRMTHLYVVDISTKTSRRLTKGTFTVGDFNWSPDDTHIAFDHRINGDNANSGTADISVATVADGAVRPLVTEAGPDTNPVWSPDGNQIAFESSLANPSFFYTNRHLALISASGGPIKDLTAGFDEDASIVAWQPAGLLFSASQRTAAALFRLDVATDHVTKMLPADSATDTSFSLTTTGSLVAFIKNTPSTFTELCVANADGTGERTLTAFGDQTVHWVHPTQQVVQWKSQDGATVEGVLHKPADFVAGRRYPLLVVIHGGPTGISRPAPFNSTSTYPIDIWLSKGALVLEPNYRGSAGYGEAFRALNVKNLGIGDAWDVLSGIDALIAQGLVDSARVGAMGWSQGGYISAFLTTHDSARFKAISVGAGISDWMTYYVSTDITPFTRQYLKATPWDDPEIYRKTSPITYIKSAKTPTLIQHGATDQRVPPPDAFELYRGLLDQGVPTKLIVYRGFEGVGHGPSKPKSSRAVMQHNLDWFDEYFFGK